MCQYSLPYERAGVNAKVELDWPNHRLIYLDDIEEMMPSTNELIKETDCNTEITNTEKKILSFTGLVNTAVFHTEATEIETLSPDITNTWYY